MVSLAAAKSLRIASSFDSLPHRLGFERAKILLCLERLSPMIFASVPE